MTGHAVIQSWALRAVLLLPLLAMQHCTAARCNVPNISAEAALLCRVEAAWRDHRSIEPSDLPHLRHEVGEMFDFGLSQYMARAFPHDNLLPHSCKGRDWQGGIGVTLIDSLDALLLLGRRGALHEALDALDTHITFDKDEKVHVFETTIRVLGGLLSAHMLLTRDPGLAPGYHGSLLDLAADLAERLLPAFNTASGLPLPWAHLQGARQTRDLPDNAITDTAAVGTLLLEFGTLSALTGRRVFVAKAREAAAALWARRSQLGLVGGGLSVAGGHWVTREATIGPGADSFYEYLLKAYLMLGDPVYLDMFAELYSATMRHLSLPAPVGHLHTSFLVDVNMDTGKLASPWVSSLGAFWPGMQALIGQDAAASQLHSNYTAAWRVFGWLPEAFTIDLTAVNPQDGGYNLRPEHMESTYLLHAATGDAPLVALGATMLRVVNASRAPCGFAGIADVTTGATSDLMESFLLSETLKYLYLLFTDGGHHLADYFVMSTEGHLLPSFPAEGDEEEAAEQVLLQQQQQEAARAPAPAAAPSGGGGCADGSCAAGGDPLPPAEDSAAPPPSGGAAGRGSALPPACARICRRRSPDELAAAERTLAGSLPLVPVRRADSVRLRRRRCRACVAVARAMSSRPPATDAERAQRLNLGNAAGAAAEAAAARAAAERDAGGGAGARAPPAALQVVGQILCQLTMVEGGRVGCSSARRLATDQLFVGLSQGAVVIQLQQHLPQPPPLPLRLLVSVEQEEGPGVVVLEAAGATFTPAPPAVSQRCLQALARPRWRLTQQPPCPAAARPRADGADAAPPMTADGDGDGGVTPPGPQRCQVSRLPPLALQTAGHGEFPRLTGASCPNHPTHIGLDAARMAASRWLPAHATAEASHPCAGQLPRGGLPGSVVVLAHPPDGCAPPTNARTLAGAVAAVVRGGCPFADKVAAMEAAGATGVVVLNLLSEPGAEVVVMSGGDPPRPRASIPAALLPLGAARQLLYWLERRPMVAAMVVMEELAPPRTVRLSGPGAGGDAEGAADGDDSDDPYDDPEEGEGEEAAEDEEEEAEGEPSARRQKRTRARAEARRRRAAELVCGSGDGGGGGEAAESPGVSINLVVPPQSLAWLAQFLRAAGLEAGALFEQVVTDDAAVGELMRLMLAEQQAAQAQAGPGSCAAAAEPEASESGEVDAAAAAVVAAELRRRLAEQAQAPAPT